MNKDLPWHSREMVEDELTSLPEGMEGYKNKCDCGCDTFRVVLREYEAWVICIACGCEYLAHEG